MSPFAKLLWHLLYLACETVSLRVKGLYLGLHRVQKKTAP